MNCYLGIDPGLDGALVLLTPHETLAVVMPTLGSTGAKRVLDGRGVLGQLRCDWGDLAPITLAVIEEGGVRPQQGASSSHKIGVGYGRLLGLLDALGVPYEVVKPAAWKKALGLPSRSGPDHNAVTAQRKRDAVELAGRLFPDVSLLASPRCRTPHDGLAEALLLAEYARRRHAGAAAGGGA